MEEGRGQAGTVKVQDVVAMAKSFEASPLEAMREVMSSMRQAVAHTLEHDER